MGSSKGAVPTRPNISLEETRAIREIKEDRGQVILTADNGVAMVVMDRQDYIDKAHKLLSELNTYRPINKDPTNKLKNKLGQTLRDIKTHGGFSDNKYERLYSTSTFPSKFYGFPKIHKIGTPSCLLCPVVVPLPMGWQRSWPISSDS